MVGRFHLCCIVLLLASAPGCLPDAETARRDWLANRLIEDNRDFLDRDPDATAAKWQKMASDPYLFFRGTSFLFAADHLDPSQADHFATDFGSHAAAQVVVMGDPHPENLGTLLWSDGTLSIEYNDFDGALYGPYYLGLRRLAAGFGVLARRTEHLDDRAEAAIMEAVVRGYIDEIHRLTQDDSPTLIREGESNGTIADDLLRRSRRDGDALQNFDRYTEFVDDSRRFLRGDLEPPDGVVLTRRLDDLSSEELLLVDALLHRATETLVGDEQSATLHLVDAVRRWGAGVSSYPGLRYYALVETDLDAHPEILLEFKELRDPPALEGLDLWPPRPFANNGERVVTLRREFHESDATDPFLGWAVEGPLAFRQRHLTRYQRNISVDRITRQLEDGDWFAEDVEELAALAGALLARGHSRSRRADGTASLTILAELILPRREAFVEETTSAASVSVDRLFQDYRVFLELLEERGPLLGYRPATGSSPR